MDIKDFTTVATTAVTSVFIEHLIEWGIQYAKDWKRSREYRKRESIKQDIFAELKSELNEVNPDIDINNALDLMTNTYLECLNLLKLLKSKHINDEETLYVKKSLDSRVLEDNLRVEFEEKKVCEILFPIETFFEDVKNDFESVGMIVKNYESRGLY